MKIISEIYTEYKIMPSLQKHMLRVASVASLICDNFDEPLDKEEIITACLLHDMGNIIKFKLGYLPEFLEPEGLEYWQKIQDEFKSKYGNDEHLATIKIANTLGVSNSVLDILKSTGFLQSIDNASSFNFMPKISTYSDMRVTPHGLTLLQNRLDDLKLRYSKDSPLHNYEVQEIHESLYKMEKQIFAKCKIKPEDINDETVVPIILELRNFVIK